MSAQQRRAANHASAERGARQGKETNVVVTETLPVVRRQDIYEEVLEELNASELERLKRGLYARGREVVDPFGRPVGTVSAVMVDRESGRPQWLAIEVSDGVTAIPIKDLQVLADQAYVACAAPMVFAAPQFEAHYLPASVERALCDHYGCDPTRGALTDPDEKRATGSRAFWSSDVGGDIGWLPGPRGML